MSKSIVQNVIAKGILNIFNILLPLVLIPYVYRILGPENVGKIEYTITLYTYFGMIGMLGIYNYGLREISSNRNNATRVQDIYINLFSIGVLSNLICFILYTLFVTFVISDPLIQKVGYIYSLNLLSQIIYIEWVNEAYEEFKFITIKTIIIRLLSFVAIISLVNNVDNVLLYVGILSITSVVNYLVSYIYAQQKFKLSIRGGFRNTSMRCYIYPLLVILVLNNTGILYTVADKTILGNFASTRDVAMFSLGQKIIEAAKTLVLSVAFATLPRLSLYLKEDYSRYQEGLVKVMRYVIALVIPISVGMCCLSKEIILLMGGGQYIDAIPAMHIFSVRLILLGVDSIIYNQVIFLHRKEKIIVALNVLCGSLNVLLDLLLIRIMSPLIAILTTLICEIIFEIVVIYYVKREIKIDIGIFAPQNKIYFMLSLFFIPMIMLIKQMNIGGMSTILLSILCCGVIYFLILYKRCDPIVIEILSKTRIQKWI